MFYDVLSKFDLGSSFTERYIPKISDFAQLWNKHSMLFDAGIDIEMQRFIWIHDAVSKREIDLTEEYFKFAVAISERFDHITRKALWEGTFGIQSSNQEEIFEFFPWSTDDMAEKQSIDFLIENWKKFSQE